MAAMGHLLHGQGFHCIVLASIALLEGAAAYYRKFSS